MFGRKPKPCEHVYHAVVAIFENGRGYRYERDKYDFCIKCGQDKPEALHEFNGTRIYII